MEYGTSDYARYIEHSVLKPDTGHAAVKRFCEEAMMHHFAAVAVTPVNVRYAAELLKDSNVIVDAAIGFPLGTSTTFVKVAETIDAIRNGAGEIDMVINIGAMKDGRYDEVEADIREVTRAAHPDIPVKVIIETFLLTDKEKVKACELAVAAGADYVKTCTGFSGGQATPEDVRLMKRTVGDRCAVKASTGIDSREKCDALILAGATRLGTSKGINIVNGG